MPSWTNETNFRRKHGHYLRMRNTRVALRKKVFKIIDRCDQIQEIMDSFHEEKRRRSEKFKVSTPAVKHLMMMNQSRYRTTTLCKRKQQSCHSTMAKLLYSERSSARERNKWLHLSYPPKRIIPLSMTVNHKNTITLLNLTWIIYSHR